MKEIEISMSELRQKLGDLVNRAAYGKERIVLVSHGQPKAAIIGVEDLRRLQEMNESVSLDERYERALTSAQKLRERIAAWQKEQGIQPIDITEILRQLREEDDHGTDGVY